MSTPPPTQESLLSSFKQDHDRFERVIQRLSEEQQLRPISPEGWSVKDFLAHMAHWNTATNAVLVAYLHYQPLPEVVPSGDEANAQMRQQDSSRSLQEVHQYWQESHTHLLHMLTDELDDTRLAEEVRAPWSDDQIAICVLLMEMCEHDREHFLFIERHV